jgi:Immunity protein 51
MPTTIRIERLDGDDTLTFDCGDNPVDDMVLASGDEPNGHFWESVASFVAPRLARKVELDSEGSMFCAIGKRRHLERLRRELEPLLSDEGRLRSVLAAARNEGFTIEG